MKRRLLLALGGVWLTILIAAGGFYVAGWRMWVMTTPSMSPRLSVGALVVTAPLQGLPRAGETVAFTAPGTSTVFVHQIIGGDPASGYQTKGRLNSSPDPWRIRPSAILGVAQLGVPDLGWLVRALPIWILLAFLWGLLWRWLGRGEYHAWAWTVGAAGVAIPVLIWHPLVNGQVVTAKVAAGKVHVYLVSTGILPERVEAGGKASSVIMAGHAQILTLTRPRQGLVAMHLSAALPIWGYALLAFVCCLPLTAAVLQTLRQPEDESPAAGPATPGSQRKPAAAPAGQRPQRAGLPQLQPRLSEAWGLAHRIGAKVWSRPLRPPAASAAGEVALVPPEGARVRSRRATAGSTSTGRKVVGAPILKSDSARRVRKSATPGQPPATRTQSKSRSPVAGGKPATGSPPRRPRSSNPGGRKRRQGTAAAPSAT